MIARIQQRGEFVQDARSIPDESSGRPHVADMGWQSPPGPVDRISFFEEQARHRRASWRVTALCVLAVVVTAIPFSAIVGPLYYAAAALALRIMALVMPVPDHVWIPFRGAWHMMDRLIDSLDRIGPGDALGVIGTILILLSPGILGIIATWLWLRLVLTSDGVGGVLLQLGAREPRSGDIEEQQLSNIVAEMAIAGGIQPPRVLLIDAPVANAAAIGTGEKEATVVVSRRLLDELDRDETQGVLGHLIGSIGNGDLRIGILILSVFQTIGLLATILDVPISGAARLSLFRFFGAIVTGRGKDGHSAATIAATLLGESMGDRRMKEIDVILEAPDKAGLNVVMKVILNVRRVVMIPFLLLSLFGKMVLTVVASMLMGQTIAWAWRTRRYLADATAVQLTRNPDGIGRALQELAARGGLIPGGQWAAHLFIVGGEAAIAQSQAEQAEHLREFRERTRGQPLEDRMQEAVKLGQMLSASANTGSKGTFPSESLSLGDMHPSIAKRISRLQAQGAGLASGGRAQPPAPFWGLGASTIILVPLLLLCGALFSVAIGLVTMLAFLAFEIGMGVVILLLVPGVNP